MTINAAIDRPVARWLPSRHHFALARLIAFARLRRAPHAPAAEHLILAIDPDQTAAEMHAVALWVFLTAACYFAASLPWALPLAIAGGLVLSAVAIQLPFLIGGPLLRVLTADANHIRIISLLTMGLMTIASSWIATTATWARFAAWLFFAVLIVNALAAIVNRLLRRRIEGLEERCVR
jgi:hypothetical protein